MDKTLSGKLNLLKGSIITTLIPNALANGVVYYFMNRNNEKTAFDFWLGGTITAFVLALICGICVIPTINKKIKDGKLSVETYTKDNHIIGHIMPNNTFLQLLLIAVLVTIIFTFVSGGIPVIAGYSATAIPVVTGTILHGIQCGFMGVTTLYFVMIGCCVKNK